MSSAYVAFDNVETRNTLQGAAREGARASIPPGATNTDVTTAVNNALGAAGLPQATGATGATVTVKIRNAADTADLDVSTQTAGTRGRSRARG